MKISRTMTGLTEVAKASKKIRQEDPRTWLNIYFDFKEYNVTTIETDDRFFVTSLIRENTPEEIEEAIREWMAL